MVLVIYYLPLWFQAINNVTAVESGIMNIPMILSLVAASIVTGFSISRLGYYTPFIIMSSIIMSIGMELITTFTVDTGHATWIGYQVIIVLGMGLGMQQANVAVQTC
jgi:hypothetical protein